MAAIFGIYFYDRRSKADGEDLRRMSEKMIHRGPSGAYLSVGRNIGLGYRYSHRDRGISQCPDDGIHDVRSVVDGHFFNIDHLARRLLEKGHAVQPDNASGILNCLYKEKGFAFLPELDGAFSIALWDKRRNRLILARDRFGVKPLYYCEHSEGVVFASEIKAIVEALKEGPSINLNALSEYLMFRYVAGSSTMFEGIKEVLPGRYIVWNERKRLAVKYWSAESAGEAVEWKGPEYHGRRIESLLKDAVQKRVRYADRIGANCSGGIDSGLVTALSSIHTGRSLDTFSVGFEEREWDESRFARLTARKYRTNHHELVIRSEQFSAQLPRLNWHNDEPLSDPNSVLVALLAEYSKERIDMLLTGEGADEVFMGYPRYNILNICALTYFLPRALRSLLASIAALPKSRRAKKLALTLGLEPFDAIMLNSAFVQGNIVQSVLREDIQSSFFANRLDLLEYPQKRDLLTTAMNFEIKTYLLSSLNRLDKMNMACGLTTAVPFLDNDLFGHALKIPRRLKIGYLSNKRILRDLAAKYLPRENLRMPKSGFGVPIAKWFRTDATLKNFLDEIRDSSVIGRTCNRSKLDEIIDHHTSGCCDYSEILWLITNFHLWHKQFFQS